MGSPKSGVVFPTWFLGLLLIPLAATILGGRRAGTRANSTGEALVRGGLAGACYAVLCGVGAWAATIVLPPWAGFLGGSLSLGASPGRTAALAAVWGIAGRSRRRAACATVAGEALVRGGRARAQCTSVKLFSICV